MRSKKIKLSIMKRIAILFSVALILSVPITMALNYKFTDLKSFGTLKDTLLTSFGNNEKTRRWVLTFFEEE